MDKHYYTPLQLLKIATQHAYSAQTLLQNCPEFFEGHIEFRDPLLPIASLMYTAFQLTLKAYLLQEHQLIKQSKTLIELLELNRDLNFSSQDLELLKLLSRQVAYRKGLEYELWQDRQQQYVFSTEIMKVYERLQMMMPLELQSDYLAR